MRHLLSEKWVNTAIECCVSQRRYQHWVMESFSKSMVCRFEITSFPIWNVPDMEL
ncbi:MAG: hypothetical protein II165_07140 [Bacteroidales bacterium]|nr:hypothetical protein [Bacteroidales bacterium]